ncbi:UvrD/REP helicase [Candidatus Vecturithrix granuli]|uniref:DNA 3'-5' helicase n=1 Tax=Vecturithrix granuli TaxID=1499967 RepID=A0A081C142_VECG1|nr:UvrD/REP helicase [Candidatus Vecturithrix granuli]
MKFVADFHIHSHYSRATSSELTFEHLHKWAQLKGVQVVGSGDLTHPGWLQEMREKLEPAEEGLFRLKEDVARAMQPEIFTACQQPVRFILSGEISNIYKKHDKTRKNHHVVFLPSFEAVEKFQTSLEKIGNIRSDGRPILGLDARDLLEIVLETDPQAYLIPAHIWTPWFSLFGSKSGFDSIEECFEDLTPHIFALETGLSSDPPMNWRLSTLDRYTLVSNSDAHSPQKLAREANLFNTDLSYPAMFEALKRRNLQTFLGTIEFFPEEGKYHYDGHRKCNICWDPETTRKHNGICPVCGKNVTVGVMHRVAVLADREEGAKPDNAAPFYSLIPLPEILAEAYNIGSTSKRVQQSYEYLLTHLGSEVAILQETPLEDIERIGGGLLAEGIRRMRAGRVKADAGYDGEYGVIKLFDDQERKSLTTQLGFFPGLPTKSAQKQNKQENVEDTVSPPGRGEGWVLESGDLTPLATHPSPLPGGEFLTSPCKKPCISVLKEDGVGSFLLSGLNPQQQSAALCTDTSLIIVAGPGTGKTRTVTHRIAYLISEKGVLPENILAITFTNKAAEEMANRLISLVGESLANRMIIKTFHAFCAMILREQAEHIGLDPHFTICRETDRHTLLKSVLPALKDQEIAQCLEQISAAKNQLLTPDASPTGDSPDFIAHYRKYETALKAYRMVDFDDLIFLTVQLFETQPEVLRSYQQRFQWIAVDEYQDVNFAQYRLLKLLKALDVNLCVIGDSDQAIYGFRGADRTYFLQFQQDFPDAKTLYLNQNYRSTQSIVAASRQVILKSPESAALELWSEVVSKTKLDIYHAPTYKAEAEYVVHEIEKMVGGTTYFSLDSGRVESHAEGSYSFGDFALLYRLGAQSQPLFEAFQRSGIPYQIAGQTSLYEYKDIQVILACLWALFAQDARFYLQFLARQTNKIEPFLNELRQSLNTQPVTQLIERIHNMISFDDLDEKRTERLKRLLSRAAPFGHNLQQFLEMTVLHKETDDYDQRADRVTLMTLHASKGLEFPVVFIVGCEETLIPYQREGKTYNLEEERRLLYVGMTRAQQKLILTCAKKRFLFGQTKQNPPSRFLQDIENALKEIQQRAGRKAGKHSKNNPQLLLKL